MNDLGKMMNLGEVFLHTFARNVNHVLNWNTEAAA